ncbi:hypothetical protein ANCCAN_14875 [Ancylostoma caninum]|uniref:Uncharacterized protein n=1 Tax=Ancylostoma caninum TaxID=29170 RepID=A0A368G697_ANCCA|nr:hypothetical protein ANCCAN_14875 [Ancylostoma caninum]
MDFAAEATFPDQEPEVSVKKCAKAWKINSSPPFLELNLVELATKWQPRKKDNTYQKLAALYRFLLMRVTDPPEAVREYSIRLNDKQGRDTRLKSLPEDVENVLIGLGEDMLGFGHDEIIPGTDVDLEESR